jgi:hypothetical protein
VKAVLKVEHFNDFCNDIFDFRIAFFTDIDSIRDFISLIVKGKAEIRSAFMKQTFRGVIHCFILH